MSEFPEDQWQFGEFRLDARRKILRHGEATVYMPLKEIEVLCMLVRNRGELVTKGELLEGVWEDSFVGESNLSRHIYLLRNTLKTFGADDGLIENVPRRGYRFTGDVRAVEPDEIFVEKRTQTRTRIELPDENRRVRVSRRRVGAYVALALIFASATAFFGYQYFRSEEPAAIRSLLVLPFKIVGDGETSTYAGAGLADILTTRLSHIRNLQIRPASSAFDLEDRDPVTTGKKLEVDGVLEGSIYYLNERVRVTARLIRVSDASVVWTGEFEKLKKDELQLQNDLALQIVPALAVNLSAGERDALTKQYTLNADAYDLYVNGRYEWNKRSIPGMIEAQRLFRNAIATDPGFTLAYVGLADTLLTSQPYALEARMLINKALELDPDMAEAHASRGFYLMFYDWQWNEAESSFKRSLELNPNYTTAHHWYATLLAIKGDTEAAKSEMRKALELNPTSYNFLADLGQLYYFSGDYQEAEQYCLRALEIYPDFSLAHEYLHYIYLKTGHYDKAVAEITRADEINATFDHNTHGKEYETFDKSGDIFRQGGITGYLDLRYPGTPLESESFYLYAKKHAVVGENERALDLLEKSTEAHKFLTAFVKADPVFEGLRSEPRYQQILRKMGLS